MRADNQALWDSYARSLRALNRSEKTVDSYPLVMRELDTLLSAGAVSATKGDVRRYLAK